MEKLIGRFAEERSNSDDQSMKDLVESLGLVSNKSRTLENSGSSIELYEDYKGTIFVIAHNSELYYGYNNTKTISNDILTIKDEDVLNAKANKIARKIYDVLPFSFVELPIGVNEQINLSTKMMKDIKNIIKDEFKNNKE